MPYPPQVFSLDGHLVGKVLDDYMGRQYGTASRVTNYRRSN